MYIKAEKGFEERVELRLAKKPALLLIFMIFVLFFVDFSPAFANNLWDTRGHWAEREVSLLVTKGIINGFPDGSFRPEKEVTRAQFVKLIVEALGSGNDAKILETVSSPFKDVADTCWAKGYLLSAVERGIISTKDKNFRPNQPIKRVDMTAMVVKALGLQKQAELMMNYKLRFDDSIDIPYWAVGYVAVASNYGIITGMPDNTFQPNQTATRAQAAVIISRMLEQMGTTYDVYGFIKKNDFEKGTLLITSDGHETEFEISYDISVFKNLTPVKLKGLEPLDEIGIVLDENHKVGYVDAFFYSSEGIINDINLDTGLITYTCQGKTYQSHVKNSAQLFLNGRPVYLEGIQKGDEGYLVFENRSGSIRMAFITRFNVSGRIKVIDRSDNSLIVVSDNKTKKVFVNENSMIYQSSGEVVTFKDIEIGEYVNLAVDDDGFVEYGEVQ